MAEIYKKIDGSKYKKIFIVGDLHGSYDLLVSELEKVGFDFVNDLLISVGDLIDRGSENIKCLELINFDWFEAVRGNHEQLAINGLEGNNQSLYAWLYNGGNWYFELDPIQKQKAEKLITQCKELPLIIELSIAEKKIVIAHADYPHNKYEYGKEVSNKGVIWNRDRVENDSHISIDGADMFVFGHTPMKEPEQMGNRFYIDTGAVFNGKLTLMRVK
ncbi:metallophosphoesterase [Pasteurella multocida]|uniref:metallophosphoesterase n=1 Tax=Pasteurella multocida TaxID=747 RepID=UPI0007ECE105|nr:metallophosphoesterase [Pasteurella multocida]MCL7790101.1 metallophosphoesterase [Pasteurella multocida]MCL7822626.1 metallophosphoesterase [Pasteurella multocida]OBP35891.1 serine/threonine protein phosphatase [Pasteurella multocida subsp. multocida]URH97351.1 metallophosphoesterase [Pasteurella multocida]WRK02064.1 metallophosphoesterase [Pasteurella multocida]